MRIAFISDIHANFEALYKLSDVIENVDQVMCLGDMVGYYCQVNEVIDYVRGLNALCVLGNHDSFLLHGCPQNVPPAVRFGIEYAEKTISHDNRNWLSTLPLVWGGFIEERSVLLTHGSPWRPLSDYLYTDSQSLSQLNEFDYDIIAFGQTHRVGLWLDRSPVLINPGSVGQSRDMKAHACAIILDIATMKAERIVRTFDPTVVIDLAARNGARGWVNKHLR